MKNRIYIAGGKRQYKGNIHTHSTRSDGDYEPEEVIKAYQDKGYDFICMSDHEIYWRNDRLNTDTFFLMPGYEMACDMPEDDRWQAYHLHGLLDASLGSDREFVHDEEHEKPFYQSLATIQELIDDMKKRGNLVIMNHPEWSKNRAEDLIQLDGYLAVEIYNHQSELDEAVGYSVSHWDYLLSRGRKVYAVAADDAHRGDYRAEITEFFGGWIQVQAEEFHSQSVIEALKLGSFYSSTGPQIHDLRVEDGILKVTCSEVKFIRFITYPLNGRAIFDPEARPVTSGMYDILGDEVYIRVECVDFEGNRAWSNPIYPDELFSGDDGQDHS